MYLGILLRLLLSAMFFTVAWYALRPENFSLLIRGLEERLNRPANAFERASALSRQLRKACYALSALFFLFACIFLYHNLRRLQVTPPPILQSLPYSRERPIQPAAGSLPYSGPGTASGKRGVSAFPRASHDSLSGAQSLPYSGAGAASEPKGAGGQPQASPGPGSPSGKVRSEGGIQPYTSQPGQNAP